MAAEGGQGKGQWGQLKWAGGHAGPKTLPGIILRAALPHSQGTALQASPLLTQLFAILLSLLYRAQSRSHTPCLVVFTSASAACVINNFLPEQGMSRR